MGSRYKGSSARGRMTAYAAKGPHWAAKNAPEKVDETFSPGERARLARTGRRSGKDMRAGGCHPTAASCFVKD